MDSTLAPGRRLEDVALRMAQSALAQPVGPATDPAGPLACAMLAFHRLATAREGAREGELSHLMRRISDPPAALPLAIERIGQVRYMLGEGALDVELVHLARQMLDDALRALGRPELVP